MAAPAFKKRVVGERNPEHELHRAMVNGMFSLPSENVEAMKKIRVIFQKAIDDYLDVVDALEVRHEGTVTRTLQTIQQAKNIGCDSVILPFGPAPK
jgi:hypothetical protein